MVVVKHLRNLKCCQVSILLIEFVLLIQIRLMLILGSWSTIICGQFSPSFALVLLCIHLLTYFSMIGVQSGTLVFYWPQFSSLLRKLDSMMCKVSLSPVAL